LKPFFLLLLLFETNEDPKVTAAIQKACYGYFLLGGLAVEGPMGLLSGSLSLLFTIVSLFHSLLLIPLMKSLTFLSLSSLSFSFSILFFRLIPNPKVLLTHYTAVAIWGALQFLWQATDPLLTKIFLIPKILSAAANIFYPLLKAELFCDYRTEEQKKYWFYKWKRFDEICWKDLQIVLTVLLVLPKILHSILSRNKGKNIGTLLLYILLCLGEGYILWLTIQHSALLSMLYALFICWLWIK
jgi:hypothetical protein